MKTTDTENPNREEAQPHPEQLTTNVHATIHRYAVKVARVDYLYAEIEVTAGNEQEAYAAAKELADEQDDSVWDFADREFQAFEAEVIAEGGSNE